MQSTSDKSKVHHVRKTGSSVCNCLLRCSFCAACVHLFECTCLDYAVRGIVCTHIHAVNIAEPSECLMQIGEDHIEEKREELGNLIQEDKDLQNEKELEDLKRSAMSTIAELTDVLQKAPTRDTIHTALRHIPSAITVARGLSVIGKDHQYLKTKSNLCIPLQINRLRDRSGSFPQKRKPQS